MERVSEELKKLARSSANASLMATWRRGPGFLEHAYQECRSRESNLCKTTASDFAASKKSEPKERSA